MFKKNYIFLRKIAFLIDIFILKKEVLLARKTRINSKIIL